MISLKPLQFRNLTLHCNILQAPLAGISCAPFRLLTWQQGRPGMCSTEMISAHTLVNAKHLPRRYTWQHPDEGPVCYQLAGHDPALLARATRIATDLGAAAIDLNVGCPKPKVRRKGYGSALLAQPDHLQRVISAMRAATELPVSVKIRLSEVSPDHNISVIDAIHAAGADMIIIHGRTWLTDYETPNNLDTIKTLCEHSRIPVIANGDIHDIDSLQRSLQTGCDGVMIGRASIGRPWLARQLQSQAAGEPFTPPTVKDIKTLFLTHIDLLASLDGEHLALLQARRLAKHYFHWITLPEHVYNLSSFDEWIGWVADA